MGEREKGRICCCWGDGERIHIITITLKSLVSRAFKSATRVDDDDEDDYYDVDGGGER